MKKYNFSVKTALAVFAVVLSACSSDNDIVDNNSNNQEKPVAGKTMTFHASMDGDGDNATRTDFNGNNTENNTVWATGDAISILNKASVPNEEDIDSLAEFGITDGIGTKEADFEGGPIRANGEDNDQFYAFYPSSCFNPDSMKMIGNIPTVQTAMDKTYDQSLHFMTAYSTNTTFAFKNACALLKITLNGNSTDNSNPVCRVKVVANPTLINVYDSLFQYTSIAGDFEATVNDKGIATATPKETKKTYVELRASANDATAKTSLGNGTFYMVVLPATISNGFTLLLEKTDGTIYQRINTNITSFGRNQMINLGSYNCSSTPTGMTALGNDVVDLDLPSGTIWCKKNVKISTKSALGVTYSWYVDGFVNTEEDYGDYFSFGKTHVPAQYNTPSLEQQTLKTSDDAVYQYDPKYCTPIFAQIFELFKFGPYTTVTSSLTGLGGARFEVANGRYLWLPYGGHYAAGLNVGLKILEGDGEEAAYWSRTDIGTGFGVVSYKDAYCLDLKDDNGVPVVVPQENGRHFWSDDRQGGRNIRPVITNIKIAPIFE